jgi:hypothetical protein
VPVHVATDLSPAQVKAYRLADNRTAEETSWDLELLPLELEGLVEPDHDLDLLGFDEHELTGIMARPNEGLSDPDLIPEPPLEAVTPPATSGSSGATTCSAAMPPRQAMCGASWPASAPR